MSHWTSHFPSVPFPMVLHSKPRTLARPVLMLLNPMSSKPFPVLPQTPKVYSMKFSKSCWNAATSKKPFHFPKRYPCLIPISMLVEDSGRMSREGNTLMPPTVVRINFSAMLGNRKPSPMLARKKLACPNR